MVKIQPRSDSLTQNRSTRYLITLLIISTATGLQWLLWPLVGPAPFILFYPAIILAALYGDGLSAIILATLSTQYFFVPPMYSFQVTWPSGVVRQVLFIFAAFMIRSITQALVVALSRAQAEKEKAQEAERSLSTVLRDLELKRDALENSLNGFDIVNSKGEFVYANRAYLKMWGYDTLEEILGTSPSTHCADPSVPEKIIRSLKETGQCDIEFTALRKDGSTFEVRMWAWLGQDVDGNEIYPTSAIDITEQKRAVEALKYQRDLTQIITDNATSGLFMMDEKGHPTYMNPAAARITGYNSLDEIRDRPLHYAVHWKKPDGSPYPMDECPIDNAHSALKAVQNQEEVFCTKDGRLFPVSYSVAPLEKDGHVIGSVLEFQDITGLKKVQHTLEEAVRARDEFLSIASHELKTPLTSLKLQAQMRRKILAKGDSSAFSLDKLSTMIENDVRQIQRLARLIEDMLDISRINTGKLPIQRESFDLCTLVQDVVNRHRAQLESTGSSIETLCCDQAIGHWDRFRLEQVLINLLTNASRYGAGRPVSVSVVKESQKVCLTVRDNGIGIAPENQERIFQRFERAVSASEISGLGLGLYISKQIVEMHGGKIGVESEFGKGSTFTVELPVEAT